MLSHHSDGHIILSLQGLKLHTLPHSILYVYIPLQLHQFLPDAELLNIEGPVQGCFPDNVLTVGVRLSFGQDLDGADSGDGRGITTGTAGRPASSCGGV